MAFRKLVLMYHAIKGPAAPAVAGSFPISLERFQRQIRSAARAGWRFGRLSALREPVDADTLYITGDDGTVDWALNVLPWCEQQGIPTHTALISGPWLRPPVYPVAHRLQILLTLPQRELPMPDLPAEQRAYIDRVYAYETSLRRRYLKGACNLVLDDWEARGLLGLPDVEEERLLAARFAQPEAYATFGLAEFGVHTVTHRAFAGDVSEYMAQEILPCREALLQAGLRDSGYFTLPMRPRYPAMVEQLVPALVAHGFAGVLDGTGEWDGRSFIVPRIDAKNVEQVLGLPPLEEESPVESHRLARAALS